MKRGIIIIGTILVAVVLTAFGFMNKQEIVATHEGELQAVAVSENLEMDAAEAKQGMEDQEVMYAVRETYKKAISRAQLEKAESLGDLIPNYPSNWITDYVSVEILATCNNKEMKAISPNDVLSIEQKEILHSVDLAASINIHVSYNTKNDITNLPEPNEMKVSMAVVPKEKAAYKDGHDQLIAYLRKKGQDKIFLNHFEENQPATILFTVNEQGDIEDVELTRKSKDAKVDAFLVELIRNMPKWKPAKSVTGFVKQKFEFSVGPMGC